MDSRERNTEPIDEAIDLFNRIQLAIDNEEKVRYSYDGEMASVGAWTEIEVRV
jgi:hypothetical protein